MSKPSQSIDRIIHADCGEVAPKLGLGTIDLLLLDPPYNLDKRFGKSAFKSTSSEKYAESLEAWLKPLVPLLKPNASVYICGDWRSSAAIQTIGQKFLKLRNRITWEREKGRGAKTNWKSCSEDIWYFTVSNEYKFNDEAVKLKRRVIAPYRENGKPKDWTVEDGEKTRLTSPSNLWTDITVPFWSMRENTDHPTQKPEKLAAKLILASSDKGDLILDPFCGSGTFPVTAKKLGRRFIGIESDLDYCLVALKRLQMAEQDDSIQGYEDGVFRERNAVNLGK
ncbi:MAG: site-specific DNA-methyltransferase [Pyrinomonadaceae bacterium]